MEKLRRENDGLKNQLGQQNARLKELEDEYSTFMDEDVFDLVNSMCNKSPASATNDELSELRHENETLTDLVVSLQRSMKESQTRGGSSGSEPEKEIMHDQIVVKAHSQDTRVDKDDLRVHGLVAQVKALERDKSALLQEKKNMVAAMLQIRKESHMHKISSQELQRQVTSLQAEIDDLHRHGKFSAGILEQFRTGVQEITGLDDLSQMTDEQPQDEDHDDEVFQQRIHAAKQDVQMVRDLLRKDSEGTFHQ